MSAVAVSTKANMENKIEVVNKTKKENNNNSVLTVVKVNVRHKEQSAADKE